MEKLPVKNRTKETFVLKNIKKTLGMKPKARSKEDCDKEYTHHAMMVGHNTRIINQLQAENENHLERLIAINAEAMRFPAEPKAAPAAAPQVESEST